MSDLISRKAAIDLWEKYHPTIAVDAMQYDAELRQLPPILPVNNSENPNSLDVISRQAAIDALLGITAMRNTIPLDSAIFNIKKLPSAQPERTCVNCGRTVNNGGWYADGGTRCPIEEHYALPKDGFCHLWEKRNVTDDDYPERDRRMTNIQAINLLKGLEQSLDDYCELNDEGKIAFRMAIATLELFGNSEQLPPAQPEIIRCKDCKHFEYDHLYIIQGISVLGHEVCNAWGDGCKTDENGYCFMAERRTDGTD